MIPTNPGALVALLAFLSAAPQGWPQYHGANGDRSSTESIGLTTWPEDGPKVAWRTKTATGFSSISVAGGRAFTLVRRDDAETLLALDVDDGDELWSARLTPLGYDRGGGTGAKDNRGGDGPRSTPSVDGGRVYAFDAALHLHCFDVADGECLWSRDLLADHEGRNVKWQNAASPLIEGDHVFVVGGGAGQSLLAFDKESGELAWATGDETMTHATPIATTIHDQRQVIFYVRSGLIAVEPASGKELWRIDYPFRTSSAASPVVHGDLVYVSAGYGVGAGVYRIVRSEDGFASEFVWRQRNKLMNHWSTPVCRDGYLYGMFGFKKFGVGPLCCVELATGKTLWSEPGFGPGNVIAVGDTLVALSDAGDVVLAEVTPEAYREQARARLLKGKCWSSPSFSDGQLYVRSTVEAVRVDLSEPR